MITARKSLAIAFVVVVGGGIPLPSQAVVRDTLVLDGGFHDGPLGSLLNDVRSFQTAANSAYTLQGVRFDGSVFPQQRTTPPNDWPTFARDLFVSITHDRTGSQADIRLGHGTSWIQDPLPALASFAGTDFQLAGVQVLPGDSFTVELWDEFDDLVGPDATWSDLELEFTDDFVPPLPPVGEGIIRIDARGRDSFPTSNGSIDPPEGATFWGVAFGPDDGTNRSAIRSITFDTQNVSEVWWQDDNSNGQFVVGESQGIDIVPTRTNGRLVYGGEDPSEDGNFSRLVLNFQDEDFEPGDSLRFGNDIDSLAPTDPPLVADIFSSGDDFARYDPGIRVVVQFHDGSVAAGILDDVAPGESHRGYVDILLDPGPGFQADFDKDGDVDGQDFLTWQTNFPQQSGATPNDGDANGDGRIDGADFLLWQSEFGQKGIERGRAVPEPTAVALAAPLLGAVLFGPRRRRAGG